MHAASAPPAPESAAKILRLPEVIGRTGLRRDSIYRLGREGKFPRPLKISARATGWLSTEIDEFVARCAQQRP